MGDKALVTAKDASLNADGHQTTAVTGSKRKRDADSADQNAMQAELDALQQKNNSLMRKLTRVMHDSRLMQEENFTMRHIIAAVAGSPSGGRADAAFIHSRDADQHQQLQRQPSNAIGFAAVTAAATPAAAGSAAAAASARWSVAQQGVRMRSRASSPGCTPPMDIQQAAAAGLLPVPLQLIYPAASQQLSSKQQHMLVQQFHQQPQQQAWHPAQVEQWHCGLVQLEEPYHTKLQATAGTTQHTCLADAADMTVQATHVDSSKPATKAEAADAVAGGLLPAAAAGARQAGSKACLRLTSPEPAVPVLEKAAAVLKSSKQAGLLHGAEVSNITAALTSKAAVICKNTNGTGSQAALEQLGSKSQQRPQTEGSGHQAAAGTTAVEGQISQQLLEKVAACALAQAKGEASSALLRLVTAGTGVPVDTMADTIIPC